MELWDAYDRNGNKTGEILVRGEPIPEGRYHLVSEVLVRHVDGSYLCMIRSREKPNYPLYPRMHRRRLRAAGRQPSRLYPPGAAGGNGHRVDEI